MSKIRICLIILLSTNLFSCGYAPLENEPELPSDYTYIIGAGDSIEIYVWDNPDISRSVTVRPDGKINTPLLDDTVASGKTPSELSREIEKGLSKYVRDPLVAVIVNDFVGIYEQQVRVIGQISGGSSGGSSNRFSAKSLPYRTGMTLLDLLIDLGGIGKFGDGNRSSIIRDIEGEQKQFGIRIDDLIDDGDLTANVRILPGDIVLVPEVFF